MIGRQLQEIVCRRVADFIGKAGLFTRIYGFGYYDFYGAFEKASSARDPQIPGVPAIQSVHLWAIINYREI